MPFWNGFYKRAAEMLKGMRSDKSVGLKPQSMVSSKGGVTPPALPAADKIGTSNNMKPLIKQKAIPMIRKITSRTHI